MSPETTTGEYIPGLIGDQDDETDIDGFEPRHGVVPSKVDVSKDEHPIRQALGPSDHRQLEAYEGKIGERFAYRYDTPEACFREYLANGETGCLNAARYLLHTHDPATYDEDWFESHDNSELFDEAKAVVGYQPVIETHHAEPGADRPRFLVEDNGIGISIREFMALRKLGLSANHGVGEQLGDFGQGVMSVFNLVGQHGRATLETHSRVDDANYRERFMIDGFNDLPGERDGYGTTWIFPAFCDEARDVDVSAAIEEYSQLLSVPVIHHEYNDESVEVSKEEYTPCELSGLFDDDTALVEYEDDCIEAVAAKGSSPATYLISMPIERNDPGDTQREAPFPMSVRIKAEDGRIYRCTCPDEDHEGLLPVEDPRYEAELVDDRDAVHPGQLVPNDVVGYDVHDSDGYVVPHGVDDELVESTDGLRFPDTIEVDVPIAEHHPDPDLPCDAVVVAGSHEGRRLVSEATWHEMDSTVPETYVPYSELTLPTEDEVESASFPQLGVDVPLPTPVDDRDRLESHTGALFELVSQQLNAELKSHLGTLATQFNDAGFDAWYDLDQTERELFTLALSTYTRASSPDTDSIRHAFQSTTETIVDSEICEKLSILFDTVEHAGRDCRRPNRTSSRSDRTISSVLRDAGDDGTVYMGATVHADKAELAWALHEDNQVVAVEGAHKYETFNRLFDWVPLKNLSLHEISDTYDVDDELASRLERSATQSHDGGGGVSLSELDAGAREVKIRSAAERRYKSVTAKEIEEQLDSDTGTLTDDDGVVEYLLVFRETAVDGVGFGSEYCVGTISRTIVPNYVAEYLEDIERCYVVDGRDPADAIESIRERMSSVTVPTMPVDQFVTDDLTVRESVDTDEFTFTTTPVCDLDDDTIAVLPPAKLNDLLEKYEMITWPQTVYEMCESLIENGYLTEETTTVAIPDPATIQQSIPFWHGNPAVSKPDEAVPQIIRHRRADTVSDVPVTNWSPSGVLTLDVLLPEETFPRDTVEWTKIVERNSYNIRNTKQSGMAIVDLFHHLAEELPADTPIFPSLTDDS